MKKIVISGYLAINHLAANAGIAGRKGVSDDQLLAFTTGLISVLLLFAFYREILRFFRQLGRRFFSHLNTKNPH